MEAGSDAMQARAFALSTLLCASLMNSSVADAATVSDGSTNLQEIAPTTMPSGLMQVAESNTRSPNKLADKYMSGLAGGRYGVGGSEPQAKHLKNKKKKITPCCAKSG
jgi:hypothetical protein